jgi:hypothetical protein
MQKQKNKKNSQEIKIKLIDTKFLFYILVNIWTKSYHETDTNKLCSIDSIHI